MMARNQKKTQKKNTTTTGYLIALVLTTQK